MALFSEKIFFTTLLFAILKVKFSVAEIVQVIKKKVTVIENYLLICIIGNLKVVENIFPPKN